MNTPTRPSATLSDEARFVPVRAANAAALGRQVKNAARARTAAVFQRQGVASSPASSNAGSPSRISSPIH